jgi:hypothetical protein
MVALDVVLGDGLEKSGCQPPPTWLYACMPNVMNILIQQIGVRLQLPSDSRRKKPSHDATHAKY